MACLIQLIAFVWASTSLAQVQLPAIGRIVASVFSRDLDDVSQPLLVAHLIGQGTTAANARPYILKCELKGATPECGDLLPLPQSAKVSDIGGGYAFFPHSLNTSHGIFAQLQTGSTMNELQLVNVDLNFTGGIFAPMWQTYLHPVSVAPTVGMPNAFCRNSARAVMSYMGTAGGSVFAITYPLSASSPPTAMLLQSVGNSILGITFMPASSPAQPGDGTLYFSAFTDNRLFTLPLTNGGLTPGTLSTPAVATNGLLDSFAPTQRLFLSESIVARQLTTSATQVSQWTLDASAAGSLSCQAVTQPDTGVTQPVVFNVVSPGGAMTMLRNNFSSVSVSGDVISAPAVNGSGLVCSSAFIARVEPEGPLLAFFTAVRPPAASNAPVQYVVDLATLTLPVPSPSRLQSASGTASPSQTASGSQSLSASPSLSCSASGTASASYSPSTTASSSYSPSVTVSSSYSPSVTMSSSGSLSTTASPATVSARASPVGSGSPSAALSSTPAATGSPTASVPVTTLITLKKSQAEDFPPGAVSVKLSLQALPPRVDSSVCSSESSLAQTAVVVPEGYFPASAVYLRLAVTGVHVLLGSLPTPAALGINDDMARTTWLRSAFRAMAAGEGGYFKCDSLIAGSRVVFSRPALTGVLTHDAMLGMIVGEFVVSLSSTLRIQDNVFPSAWRDTDSISCTLSTSTIFALDGAVPASALTGFMESRDHNQLVAELRLLSSLPTLIWNSQWALPSEWRIAELPDNVSVCGDNTFRSASTNGSTSHICVESGAWFSSLAELGSLQSVSMSTGQAVTIEGGTVLVASRWPTLSPFPGLFPPSLRGGKQGVLEVSLGGILISAIASSADGRTIAFSAPPYESVCARAATNGVNAAAPISPPPLQAFFRANNPCPQPRLLLRRVALPDSGIDTLRAICGAAAYSDSLLASHGNYTAANISVLNITEYGDLELRRRGASLCPPYCDASAVLPYELPVQVFSQNSPSTRQMQVPPTFESLFSAASGGLLDGNAPLATGVLSQAFSNKTGPGFMYVRACVPRRKWPTGILSLAFICGNASDPRSRPEAGLCIYGEPPSCQECVRGALCPGGWRQWSRPGFWLEAETSVQLPAPCAYPANTRCLEWDVITGKTKCGHGYGGYRCGNCLPGYYAAASEGGACLSCPSNDFSAAALAFIPIAIVMGSVASTGLVLAGIAIVITKRSGGSVRGGLRRLVSFAVALFLTLMSLSEVANNAPPNSPPLVRGVFSGLKALQGEGLSPVPLACLSQRSRLMAPRALMASALFLEACWVLIALVWLLHFRAEALPAASPFAAFFAWLVGVGKASAAQAAGKAVLGALGLLYGSVTATATSYAACSSSVMTLREYRWLQTDYSTAASAFGISAAEIAVTEDPLLLDTAFTVPVLAMQPQLICFEGDHNSMYGLAVAVLLLFTVGFPLLSFGVVYGIAVPAVLGATRIPTLFLYKGLPHVTFGGALVADLCAQLCGASEGKLLATTSATQNSEAQLGTDGAHTISNPLHASSLSQPSAPAIRSKPIGASYGRCFGRAPSSEPLSSMLSRVTLSRMTEAELCQSLRGLQTRRQSLFVRTNERESWHLCFSAHQMRLMRAIGVRMCGAGARFLPDDAESGREVCVGHRDRDGPSSLGNVCVFASVDTKDQEALTSKTVLCGGDPPAASAVLSSSGHPHFQVTAEATTNRRVAASSESVAGAIIAMDSADVIVPCCGCGWIPFLSRTRKCARVYHHQAKTSSDVIDSSLGLRDQAVAGPISLFVAGEFRASVFYAVHFDWALIASLALLRAFVPNTTSTPAALIGRGAGLFLVASTLAGWTAWNQPEAAAQQWLAATRLGTLALTAATALYSGVGAASLSPLASDQARDSLSRVADGLSYAVMALCLALPLLITVAFFGTLSAGAVAEARQEKAKAAAAIKEAHHLAMRQAMANVASLKWGAALAASSRRLRGSGGLGPALIEGADSALASLLPSRQATTHYPMLTVADPEVPAGPSDHYSKKKVLTTLRGTSSRLAKSLVAVPIRQNPGRPKSGQHKANTASQ